MRYFFYGTLLDDVVRTAVLRRRLPAAQLRAAELAGFRRVYRRGADYPVLITDAAGRVVGLLVSGLGAGDAARLARYEGADYVLARAPVKVAGGGVLLARLFLPRRETDGSAEAWCYDQWRRHAASRSRRQVMRHRRAPSATAGEEIVAVPPT